MKRILVVVIALMVSIGATQIIAGGNKGSTGLDSKVAVCHKFGLDAEKTLWVPLSAVAGHEAHGDQAGPCSQG